MTIILLLASIAATLMCVYIVYMMGQLLKYTIINHHEHKGILFWCGYCFIVAICLLNLYAMYDGLSRLWMYTLN